MNYVTRQANADPPAVVNEALGRVGPHGVSPGYRSYETLCTEVSTLLTEARPDSSNLL